MPSNNAQRNAHAAAKAVGFLAAAQIPTTPADLATLQLLFSQGLTLQTEQAMGDDHLNELIVKPWGQEYRVYCDDLLDVWHLAIKPGEATSLHTHVRKITHLLCIGGQGRVINMTGAIAIERGSLVRIARGAFHSSENTSTNEPLQLIEVETPRNKYDLVRLRDGYNREGKGYERTFKDMAPAIDVPFRPNARLRPFAPDGVTRFSLVPAAEAITLTAKSGFLIDISLAACLSEQCAVFSTADRLVKLSDASAYLHIALEA